MHACTWTGTKPGPCWHSVWAGSHNKSVEQLQIQQTPAGIHPLHKLACCCLLVWHWTGHNTRSRTAPCQPDGRYTGAALLEGRRGCNNDRSDRRQGANTTQQPQEKLNTPHQKRSRAPTHHNSQAEQLYTHEIKRKSKAHAPPPTAQQVSLCVCWWLQAALLWSRSCLQGQSKAACSHQQTQKPYQRTCPRPQ